LILNSHTQADGNKMVVARKQPILSKPMTLAVFQVGVDVDQSQLLESSTDFDVRFFGRPKHGESVATRPWPAMYKVFDPHSPRANFFYLHDSFLMMDEVAVSACKSTLERCGEIIPFRLEGGGSIYMYNPMSTLEQSAVDWTKTRGKLGVYSNLTLHKEAVPSASIFRLPKMGGLYVSSQMLQEDGDFFYLYRRHGLTGLYFKKLWDESSGPVPNRSTAQGDGC
jgi:hypothetical protein